MIDFEKEYNSLKNKGLTDDKVIKALISHKEKTPYTLRKKFPTEMYDKVNLMCRSYMDRMARFEVDYNFIVDIERFKNTVICCLECAPFMHSQVINSPIAPYWKVADYNIDDMVYYEEVEDIENARIEFLKNSIPLKCNIQMRIGVFICDKKTHFVFYWNHMLFDGGGFKAFWADICKNYTLYVEKNMSPVAFSSGSRKYTEVYKDLSPEKRKKAKKQFANISTKCKRTLPFKNNDKTDNVIIVYREISEEQTTKAVNFAKENGATVTDLLIAAYITALGKVSGMTADDNISVACATDLRRHIKDLSTIGYTNHVSFGHCALDRMGENFSETLGLVTHKTKELKNDEFMGLHGLPLLNIAYKTMIYLQAENVVKLFYNNPTLSVSNVGNVDKSGFEMVGNSPCDALVVGAAKNKPCAVMTCLSVKGRLKFSMCLRGNSDDEAVLNNFFDEIKRTICNI